MRWATRLPERLMHSDRAIALCTSTSTSPAGDGVTPASRLIHSGTTPFVDHTVSPCRYGATAQGIGVDGQYCLLAAVFGTVPQLAPRSGPRPAAGGSHHPANPVCIRNLGAFSFAASCRISPLGRGCGAIRPLLPYRPQGDQIASAPTDYRQTAVTTFLGIHSSP